MVGKSFTTNHDVVCGFLTMTVPALRSTKTGYVIPKFLVKKTGDEPVCAAQWGPDGPEPLIKIVDGQEVPWEQDIDVNFDVAKEKELYLISYGEFHTKTFFKVKAEGAIAKDIHTKLKKGDKVVIYGKITTVGNTNFILCDEIHKLEF